MKEVLVILKRSTLVIKRYCINILALLIYYIASLKLFLFENRRYREFITIYSCIAIPTLLLSIFYLGFLIPFIRLLSKSYILLYR